MTLQERVLQLQGLSYQAIFQTLVAETQTVLGKIRGERLKLLQSFIGATALRQRLSNATLEQMGAAAAIIEAIQPAYLAAADSYSINLADPQVASLLHNAESAGLLSSGETNFLKQLAQTEQPRWPSLTLFDVVELVSPELVNVGDWMVIPLANQRQLLVELRTPTPEPTLMRIELRESHNGLDWTQWRRITPMVDLCDVGIYYQSLPWNGLHREIRCRGEQYFLDCRVEAV